MFSLSVRALRSCLSVLSTIPSSSFSSTTVSQTLKQVMTEEKIGQKQLFTLLRYELQQTPTKGSVCTSVERAG